MNILTYLAAWRSISARIRGLERAAELHAGFLAVHSGSPYGADKYLQQQCADILTSVTEFREAFGGYIPAASISAIDRFVNDGGRQIGENTSGDAILVRSSIVKLVAFGSEMTYCLDTPMESVRSASELAFTHLQRSIVADEEYREKWQRAFTDGETHCEKLGAVHLLWHGIWAFKVDAKGGRTDLVFQEPLQTETTPAALGMVLTEWKKADDNADDAYAAARHQADLYTSGVLAGLELASHRYLVAMTERQIVPPPDIIEDAITYRHINIAVDPDTPAVAAKRLAR